MKNDSVPGLKRRPRKGGLAWYWVAPAKDVARGYAPKSVTLDPGTSQDERASRCYTQQSDLMAWRAGKTDQTTRYTIGWLIGRYKSDPLSPYNGVKAKTRDGYDDALKIIEKAISNIRIDHRLEGGVYRPRITGQDVRQWHADCGRPGKNGKRRPARARYMIAVLRILASYAVEIAVPGAKDFRELLSAIRFPVGKAREVAPSRDQVLAIVKAALAMGYRSIAITTLAQFELTERRISIIGEWEVINGARQWRPGWVWQNIIDWSIVYHQTKTGRVERAYDLREMPALLELLKATPEERRIGPIVLCETTGLPWRARHYIAAFRKVARAAGVPDTIWSMDMRAGGATEAGNIQGISSFDIQAAGGWSDAKMAARYTRDRANRAQKVVLLRQGQLASTGDCGVYFLQANGGQNCVKIGYTTDLRNRLQSLSTGCPYPVEVIGTHRGPPQMEKALHVFFRKHRTNGEWFLPAAEILLCAKRLPDHIAKQFGNVIEERLGTC